MREVPLCAAVVLALVSAGCMWPTATYIHGTAAVTQADSQQASSAPASRPATPGRMIVVKYWRVQELLDSDRMHFEFFGAEAVDQTSFPVNFPLRFYPAVWTPVLGTQHVLPNAGLVVFAEDCWPTHVIAEDGRRCCEAPSSGERHWHVVLEPMDRPPASRAPAKGWDRGEFPPLTLDELDRVLIWNWGLTQTDRAMCRRKLEQLLEYWRKNPPSPSQ